ncbi:MAG: NepR family anti-sigma factor [Sphingobium sp.]
MAERDDGVSEDRTAPNVSEPEVRNKTGAGRQAPPREGGDVATVLRSVYQRAVEEDIPEEMLDLLRKLD